MPPATLCYLLSTMSKLSHVDEQGRIRMVDTGGKEISSRRAVASARVLMKMETLQALREHHPLLLTHIDVQAEIDDAGVSLKAEVSTNAQTGVEMEALTAVSIAALTIYDMCKALDKGITISEISLESKSGGKSGDYQKSH